MKIDITHITVRLVLDGMLKGMNGMDIKQRRCANQRNIFADEDDRRKYTVILLHY